MVHPWFYDAAPPALQSGFLVHTQRDEAQCVSQIQGWDQRTGQQKAPSAPKQGKEPIKVQVPESRHFFQ
jgi:hypothetical protein